MDARIEQVIDECLNKVFNPVVPAPIPVMDDGWGNTNTITITTNTGPSFSGTVTSNSTTIASPVTMAETPFTPEVPF
jgi:hypothetical protein